MSATGFQRRRRGLGANSVEQHNTPVLPTLAGGEEATVGVSTAGVALANMTVKELRALAADKGITMGRELTAKADILAAVETALGESSAHSS